MYMKECFQCGKASYSSSSDRTWLCPYCGADLSKEKINDVDNSKPVLIKNHGLLGSILQDKNRQGNP
ncbi:hypothetical protein [Desulfitobacterium sp.]|uniref:hypothetical protein n=1 Tax=Desulfitobacterium sp. TaxID=49981 RepID=UPI002B1EA257|nr:hypothetical protein [Desulfitobacterium sp.]MEA4900713.1 hypothetical protein [Desulfitobacterium sp.]